jgi:hypothetical protein
MKVRLYLEEAGLAYGPVAVDTRNGDQFKPELLARESPGDLHNDAQASILDSTAILLYLAEKRVFADFARRLPRGWRNTVLVAIVASGVGPFSRQAVNFRHYVDQPDRYSLNRYTGVALLRAKAAVGKLKDDNLDIQAGINIVLKALEAPVRRIVENAGVEGSVVVSKINENKSETYGFDAQTEQYVDMLSAGIIDPAKVVRVALQDAASIAGLTITTEAMVAEAPKKKEAPAMPGCGMGGMDY